MTSPVEEMEVACPRCGHRWQTYWRASINLTLGEEWTDEAIEAATTAMCPECGLRSDLGALIVG